MQIKDWIASGAFVISLVSAWAAIDARGSAQELADRQFTTDKTLEILASVYSEILQSRNEPDRAKWSCFFVATLGNAEAQARKEPPYIVRAFVEDVAKAGLWNPECGSRLESLVSEDDPAATPIPAAPASVDLTAAARGPEEIGQWHALIASYNVTENGCTHARQDVRYFKAALAGTGFDDFPIYIVRTSISKNYAVTVDAGNDIMLAEALSDQIRANANPDGTGRDSFVQGNRSWTIDPNCAEFGRIES